MHEETIYDKHKGFYLDFVDRLLADESGLWHVLLGRFEAILDGRLAGARVCDVACGEGYMGAYHRMVSTYVNDLITAGFRLERLEEPLVEGGGLMAMVPKVMVVVGVAE